MGEPLGTVSAVAGIVSLGITTCEGIFWYYESYKGQRDDINQMRSSVDNLKDVLSVIESTLSHRSSGEKVNAIVEQNVARCLQGLQTLEKKLQKLRKCEDAQNIKSELIHVKNKALYPFKESTITKLRETCDDLRNSLSLAMSTLQINMAVTDQRYQKTITNLAWQNSKTSYETVAIARRLEATQDAVAASAIHSWLTPLTQVFENRHRESLSTQARQYGGAQELLQSVSFTQWESSTGTTLWYQGPPGIGKTINSAHIIESLKEVHRTNDVGIVYLYLSYKDTTLQTPVHLIASILQQLVLQRPQLFNHLESLHAQHSKTNTRPSMEDIVSVLLEVLPNFSKTFIIIDALDELSDIDEIRSVVLNHLKRLQSYTSLLLMSRPLPDLDTFFENSARVLIEASPADIENYVSERLKNTRSLQKHLMEEPSLEAVIVSRIMDKSNGMFLMARLYLDTLIHKTTRRKIKSALETLPQGFDPLYKELMDRIRLHSPKDHADLALNVLRWIFHTARPLTVLELQHALATEEGDDDLDEDGITDRDLLVTVCAGLAIIDAGSDTISFVHYTVQEYFQGSGSQLLENSHRDIAATCLTYFRFQGFAALLPDITDNAQLLQLMTQYPLLRYAAQHWGTHLRESGNSASMSNTAELLKNCSLSEALLGLKDYLDCAASGMYFRRRTRVTGLMLACYLGLTDAASGLIDGGSSVNATDSDGQSALCYVAEGGFENIALVLLKSGAEANMSDHIGWSPLHRASAKSRTTLVTNLIEYGADVNRLDGYHATPLYRASEAGAEEVVRILLNNRADVHVENSYQQTALHRAADAGHLEIVNLLIKGGANTRAKDYYGYTALYRALGQGHEQVAEVLRGHMKSQGTCKQI